MELMNDAIAQQAATYLAQADPVLAPVIAHAGLCPIRPHTDYYRALVDSIVGQQLSVMAAAAIRKRFLALFHDQFPSPEQILSVDDDTLRSLGLSYAKAGYVHDIALRMLEGTLRFDTIDTLDNQQVINELTAVKGVGDWTAHMFLMFCMGRTNVLPIGDLGVRNGIAQLYGLTLPPSPEQVTAHALQHNWHPYESVAAWYIWQSLDNTPKH